MQVNASNGENAGLSNKDIEKKLENIDGIKRSKSS